MKLDRTAWLGRPWFFLALALLALNDHVLKGVGPGWLTGKLSDFAGLVVIATLASVLWGRHWGTGIAGVSFVALKMVPGVAEAVAPLLGGGVTLRDVSDLAALIVLPPLWMVLRPRRSDRTARDRRHWQVMGLIAAVVVTTATSPPPQSEVRQVGYLRGSIYAEVFLADGYGIRWLQSADGGVTWARAEDPGPLKEPIALGDVGVQACSVDGVCYQIRTILPNDGTTFGRRVIERMSPGAGWRIEVELGRGYPSHDIDIAVDPDDSARALTADSSDTRYRTPAGEWQRVDLVALARDPQWQRDLVDVLGSRAATLLILLLVSLLSWLVTPWLAMKVVLQVVNLIAAAYILVIGLLGTPVWALQQHVKWVPGMVVLMGLLRIAWWVDRRREKTSE